MTNDFFSSLKQIYSSAGIPCAIADERLNVVWRSPSAETNRSPLKKDNVAFIFEDGKPVCGTVSVAENETVHRFNVLKADNPSDRNCLYIIEHLSSSDIKALLMSPQIRSYMTYLCARIRESAGLIAVSADEIDAVAAVFGAAYGEVTEQLNTINKGLMLILREVINPEQLYYTLDPSCDDATICISEEVASAAAEARRSLGKSTKVTCDVTDNVFSRMNRGVFETILSDMAAECCCCELYPEELVFSCELISSCRTAITVKSVNSSGRKNTPSRFEQDKKGSRLYFDYLCRVLCDKYGAAFTRCELNGGCSFRMEIDVIDSGGKIVMSSSKFSMRSERFCAMTLSLAEHHLEKRYKFIDIDSNS